MELNPTIYNTIKLRARGLLAEAIKIRRYLHMNPELSFKEHNTAGYVVSYLDDLGLPYIKNIAGTGIIATLKGEGGDGPTIALRAELDALPVNEENNVDYRSQTDGVMHACGHDAHMAMLLSSAILLKELKSYIKGTILFIFQPGEELVPGGASLILKEGTLRMLKPDAIIAQHVLPEMESGKVGFRTGKYMASSDEIYIEILGKGGHAALPGVSTDQVLIASELVCALKSEINNSESENPLILGIGRLIADGATNVIPEKVHIEGTLRTFDESLRNKAHKAIAELCKKIAANYGVEIREEIRKGYPVLINDVNLVNRAIKLSGDIYGSDRVEDLPLRMSSEDFAFYSHEIPALFYRLGVKNPTGLQKNLHTAIFDIDEGAMETGISFMSSLAIDFTNNLK
jgi:amidohydrolase